MSLFHGGAWHKGSMRAAHPLSQAKRGFGLFRWKMCEMVAAKTAVRRPCFFISAAGVLDLRLAKPRMWAAMPPAPGTSWVVKTAMTQNGPQSCIDAEREVK